RRGAWARRPQPPGARLFSRRTAITARAASLYFRYGGAATSVFGGVRVLSAAGALRWSGIAAHATVPNLTSLATDYSRDVLRDRFSPFGILSQAGSAAYTARERLATRPSIDVPTPSVDVEGQLLDRLDPAARAQTLSRF